MPLVKTTAWREWASGICTPHEEDPYVSIAHCMGQWDLLVLTPDMSKTLLHLFPRIATSSQNTWIWRAIKFPQVFPPHILLAMLKVG